MRRRENGPGRWVRRSQDETSKDRITSLRVELHHYRSQVAPIHNRNKMKPLNAGHFNETSTYLMRKHSFQAATGPGPKIVDISLFFNVRLLIYRIQEHICLLMEKYID